MFKSFFSEIFTLTLKGFLKKELTQVLRDPKLRSIIFITPVIQLTLFGVAISTEVKNIRLYAHFQPKDTVMRELYDHAIASKWFIPADIRSDDPFEEVQGGEADAVLIAPPHDLTREFEHNLGQGSAPIQLLVNASNVIRAQATEVYLQAILREVLSDRGKNPVPEPPIRFQVRILYNPSLETAFFMVPGVMCTVICLMTLILTNMSISREKEEGTLEMLISAPVRAREIILGKTVPFVILGMVNFPLIVLTGVTLFGLPVRGSFFALVLATFFFVCTTVGIGLLISSVARNQQQAMLGGFLFLFPAILLSGMIYPLENMPTALHFLAYVDPLSHYIGLLRNIMLKGGDWSYIGFHVATLAAMAVGTVFVSFKRFHTTLT